MIHFTKDGRFFNDHQQRYLSAVEAMHLSVKVRPHTTWDALMKAIAREPELFDLTFQSRLVTLPTKILEEYQDLVDTTIPRVSFKKLIFSHHMEFFNIEEITGMESEESGTELILMTTVQILDQDDLVVPGQMLCYYSPAALRDVLIETTDVIKYYGPRIPRGPLRMGMSVFDLFEAALWEISLYGLGFQREISRLHDLENKDWLDFENT